MNSKNALRNTITSNVNKLSSTLWKLKSIRPKLIVSTTLAMNLSIISVSSYKLLDA